MREDGAVESGSSSANEVADLMTCLGRAAVEAEVVLARAGTLTKDHALVAAALTIRNRATEILAANAMDVAAARARDLPAPLIDRLGLDARGVEAMARGLEEIALLPDPIGTTIARWTRPNGLLIERRRVPLGVIGLVYESRPNVTADAGGLCLKSGNAVILRGGSESAQSNRAIHACLRAGLEAAALPAACIQLVPTADRRAVRELLGGLGGCINLVVPRGGKALIRQVEQDARVPVIGHLEGNCHVYVDGAADLPMARAIVLNAKMRRTGVCGAAETLLVDSAAAATHLQPLVVDLLEAGCEVRGDAVTQAVDPRVRAASEDDWRTEFLDAIIAVRVVNGVGGAIEHIAAFGSAHTDAIVTADAAVAQRFLDEVDSAIVLHNASTQFADGGEFGMGAEIGISTSKFHARGPVGVEELTSYKYVVHGQGQVRPR